MKSHLIRRTRQLRWWWRRLRVESITAAYRAIHASPIAWYQEALRRHAAGMPQEPTAHSIWMHYLDAPDRQRLDDISRL